MHCSRRFHAKFRNWDIGPDYEIVRVIRSGANNTMCEAKHTPTGEKVSIKRLWGIFDDLLVLRGLLYELMILKHLNHPNVVKIKSIIRPKDLENFNELYIVMDYAPSNLDRLLKSYINLREDHIQQIVYNLLCALNYIQSANILHRDIQPANILFYDNCEVKICEFGLARTIPRAKSSKESGDLNTDKDRDNTVVCGWGSSARERPSTHHQEREHKASEEYYSKSSDILSMGCIIVQLFKMIQEITLFDDTLELEGASSCSSISSEMSFKDDKDAFEQSSSDETLEFKTLLGKLPNTDPFIRYLIHNMFQICPKQRFPISQALNHPYFDSIRNPFKEKRANIELNLEFEHIQDLGYLKMKEYLVRQILKYS